MNIKIRLKNKTFWISFIPAALLLAQCIGAVFGVTLDFTDLENKLLAVINALFVILALLGIVLDPTSEGLADSARVLDYMVPASNYKDKQ